MYLGIDVGTSGVKCALVDDRDEIIAETGAALEISRPAPLWSEQDPRDWWQAVQSALDAMASLQGRTMSGVRAIGLSGQMLGTALVGQDGMPLRPAPLWNDGRAVEDGLGLERELPAFSRITGARAMPGFPAAKLRWFARHEPAHLQAARWILLPKDYVRLHLTGDAVSDRADASATLLMDTAAGEWHPAILACCGVRPDQLPRLIGSAEIGGELRPELCRRWSLPRGTPVAGGGGDNMCGAVGAGVVDDGASCISLGTSGVYFVVNRRFSPSLDRGMHTHRHAVAGHYCQQAVVLSAAASLTWIAGVLGSDNVEDLVAELEAAAIASDATPIFAPYLGGERTPHNDPLLRGSFVDLGFATTRKHLVQAVMEGVSMALRDCQDALESAGAISSRPVLIGGGARSRLWASLIAAALDRPLRLVNGSITGPALGAARLARAALGGPLLAGQQAEADIDIDPRRRDALQRKHSAYRTLGQVGRGSI